MIVIRVILQVRADALETFRVHARGEGASARALDGCREYAFFEDVSAPGRVLLYEEWSTREAFDAYKRSPEFAANAGVLFPLLDGKPSSAYYQAEPVPVT